MTREEFDAKHKATQSNTEGYTDKELGWINNFVFGQIAALPLENDIERDYVKHMMDNAFLKADIYLLMYEKMRETFEGEMNG